MDEKNLKSLYDFAVSNKLDIGDYDSFKSGMEKPENRKSFHDFATQNKLDIGSYDDFEKNWSDVKKKDNSDLLFPGSQYTGAPSIGDQKETDLFPQVAAHDKVPDVSQGLGYKYGKDKSIAPQTAIKPLKKGETQIISEQPEIEGYDEANKPIYDAYRFAKNGDIKAANQILNVAATEENPYSFELRSYTNEQLGNLTDAKKDLQLAYAYSPTRIDLLPKMGVLDMKMGDAKSAEKNADEYIKVTGGVSNKQRGIAANLATSYAIKSKTALSHQEQDEFAKKSEFWKANYDALEEERKINEDAHTLTSLPDYLMTSPYSGIGLLMTPTIMAKSGVDNISTGTPSGIIKGVADIAMLGGAMTLGGSAFFAGMNAAEIVTPQGASQVFMKPITSILQLPDVQHALGKPSPEMQNWVDVADLTVGLVLMGNVSKAAELPDYMENLNKRIADRQTAERKMGEKQQEFIETETMRSDAHAQNIINGLRGIVNRTPIKVAEGDAILNEVHSLTTDQVVSGVKLHENFVAAKKTAKELDSWMDTQTQPFYRIGADLVSKDDYLKKIQELKDKGATDFDARAVNDPETKQATDDMFKPQVKPAEPRAVEPTLGKSPIVEEPTFPHEEKLPANVAERAKGENSIGNPITAEEWNKIPQTPVEVKTQFPKIPEEFIAGAKVVGVDKDYFKGTKDPVQKETSEAIDHTQWSEGGNDKAYPNFVPKNVIIVDDTQNDIGQQGTIVHEGVERQLMEKGLVYNNAHDVAAEVEKLYRKGDIDGARKMFADAMKKAEPEFTDKDGTVKKVSEKGNKEPNVSKNPQKVGKKETKEQDNAPKGIIPKGEKEPLTKSTAKDKSSSSEKTTKVEPKKEGEPDANKTGNIKQGSEPEHIGTTHGTDVPKDKEEIRKEKSGQTGDSDSPEQKTESKVPIKKKKSVEDFIEPKKDVKPEKPKSKADQLIDKLNSYKSGNKPLKGDITSMGYGGGTNDDIWDGLIDEVIKAINANKDAINTAFEWMDKVRNSDAYKKLTGDDKDDVDRKGRMILTDIVRNSEHKESGDKKFTGINNAVIDQERTQKGLEKIRANVTTRDERFAAVKENVDNGRLNATDITQGIIEGKKYPKSVASNVIKYDRMRIINSTRENQLNYEIALAQGDEPAIIAFGEEGKLLESRRELNEKAAAELKVDWHEMGMDMQGFINDDYSLSTLTYLAKVANNGKEVDAKTQSRIADLVKQYEAKIKELDDFNSNKDKEIQKLKDEATLKNLKKQSPKPTVDPKIRAAKKQEALGKIAQYFEQTFTKQAIEGEKVSGDEFLNAVRDYALLAIEDGAKSVGSIAKEIYDNFKDKFEGLTQKQIEDHIHEVGVKTPGELKTEQNLKNDIEKLKKGEELPKRTVDKTTNPDIEGLRAEKRLLEKKTLLKKQGKEAKENDVVPVKKKIEKDPFKKYREDQARKVRLLQEDVGRLQQKLDGEIHRIQLQNLSTGQKVARRIVQYRRAVLLANPTIIAKLGIAATVRTIVTPLEALAVQPLRLLLPKTGRMSPVESRFDIRAEQKTFGTLGKMQTWADFMKKLKTGKQQMEILYGKKFDLPAEALDFFGHIHAAIKSPVQSMQFNRSMALRRADNIRNGLNPDDALVDASNRTMALADAYRSIFLNDNALTDAYKSALRTWETNPKYKIWSTVAQVGLPIVKTPTNIVGEAFKYTGIPLLLHDLPKALYQEWSKKAFEKMTPEQADMTYRNLKKGIVAPLIAVMAYYNRKSIGGFYQPNEKRDKDAVKAGHVRIGNKDIPTYFLHSPPFIALQAFATFFNLIDYYKEKEGEDTTPSDIATAGVRTAVGITESVPFINTPEELMKSAESSKGLQSFASNFLSSILMPPDVSKLAKSLDTPDQTWGQKLNPFIASEPVKRKAQNILQGIELNTPYLRKFVPADETGVKKDLQDKIYKDPPKDIHDFQKKSYYPEIMKAIDKGILADSELDSFVTSSCLPKDVAKFQRTKPQGQLYILDKLTEQGKTDSVKTLIEHLNKSDATLEKLSKTDPKLYARYMKYVDMIKPTEPEETNTEEEQK